MKYSVKVSQNRSVKIIFTTDFGTFSFESFVNLSVASDKFSVVLPEVTRLRVM